MAGPDFGLLRPLENNPAYDPTKMGGVGVAIPNLGSPGKKGGGDMMQQGMGAIKKLGGMMGGGGGGGGGDMGGGLGESMGGGGGEEMMGGMGMMGGMKRGGRAKKGKKKKMGETSANKGLLGLLMGDPSANSDPSAGGFKIEGSQRVPLNGDGSCPNCGGIHSSPQSNNGLYSSPSPYADGSNNMATNPVDQSPCTYNPSKYTPYDYHNGGDNFDFMAQGGPASPYQQHAMGDMPGFAIGGQMGQGQQSSVGEPFGGSQTHGFGGAPFAGVLGQQGGDQSQMPHYAIGGPVGAGRAQMGETGGGGSSANYMNQYPNAGGGGGDLGMGGGAMGGGDGPESQAQSIMSPAGMAAAEDYSGCPDSMGGMDMGLTGAAATGGSVPSQQPTMTGEQPGAAGGGGAAPQIYGRVQNNLTQPSQGGGAAPEQYQGQPGSFDNITPSIAGNKLNYPDYTVAAAGGAGRAQGGDTPAGSYQMGENKPQGGPPQGGGHFGGGGMQMLQQMIQQRMAARQQGGQGPQGGGQQGPGPGGDAKSRIQNFLQQHPNIQKMANNFRGKMAGMGGGAAHQPAMGGSGPQGGPPKGGPGMGMMGMMGMFGGGGFGAGMGGMPHPQQGGGMPQGGFGGMGGFPGGAPAGGQRAFGGPTMNNIPYGMGEPGGQEGGEQQQLPGRAFGGPVDDQQGGQGGYNMGESQSLGGNDLRPEIVVPDKGKPYAVGLNGPEVVTPKENSFVIPNPKTVSEDPTAARNAADGFHMLAQKIGPPNKQGQANNPILGQQQQQRAPMGGPPNNQQPGASGAPGGGIAGPLGQKQPSPLGGGSSSPGNFRPGGVGGVGQQTGMGQGMGANGDPNAQHIGGFKPPSPSPMGNMDWGNGAPRMNQQIGKNNELQSGMSQFSNSDMQPPGNQGLNGPSGNKIQQPPKFDHKVLNTAINDAPVKMYQKFQQYAPDAAPFIAKEGMGIRSRLSGTKDLGSIDPDQMMNYAEKQISLASSMQKLNPGDPNVQQQYQQALPKIKKYDPGAPDQYNPAYHTANMALATPLQGMIPQIERRLPFKGAEPHKKGVPNNNASIPSIEDSEFDQGRDAMTSAMSSEFSKQQGQQSPMSQGGGQGQSTPQLPSPSYMNKGQGQQQPQLPTPSFGGMGQQQSQPQLPKPTFGGGQSQQQPPQSMGGGSQQPNHSSSLYSKIGKVEGTGKNPTSSASGKYQFINSTFGQYLKAKDPSAYNNFIKMGNSGQTQYKTQYMNQNGDKAMDWLVGQNTAHLKNAGIPISDATMYGAHFLGPAGLIKAWKAPDNAPVSSILPKGVISANKSILGGKKTVGDFKNWLNKKMGGGNSQLAQNGKTPIGMDMTSGQPPSNVVHPINDQLSKFQNSGLANNLNSQIANSTGQPTQQNIPPFQGLYQMPDNNYNRFQEQIYGPPPAGQGHPSPHSDPQPPAGYQPQMPSPQTIAAMGGGQSQQSPTMGMGQGQPPQGMGQQSPGMSSPSIQGQQGVPPQVQQSVMTLISQGVPPSQAIDQALDQHGVGQSSIGGSPQGQPQGGLGASGGNFPPSQMAQQMPSMGGSSMMGGAQQSSGSQMAQSSTGNPNATPTGYPIPGNISPEQASYMGAIDPRYGDARKQAEALLPGVSQRFPGRSYQNNLHGSNFDQEYPSMESLRARSMTQDNPEYMMALQKSGLLEKNLSGRATPQDYANAGVPIRGGGNLDGQMFSPGGNIPGTSSFGAPSNFERNGQPVRPFYDPATGRMSLGQTSVNGMPQGGMPGGGYPQNNQMNNAMLNEAGTMNPADVQDNISTRLQPANVNWQGHDQMMAGAQGRVSGQTPNMENFARQQNAADQKYDMDIHRPAQPMADSYREYLTNRLQDPKTPEAVKGQIGQILSNDDQIRRYADQQQKSSQQVPMPYQFGSGPGQTAQQGGAPSAKSGKGGPKGSVSQPYQFGQGNNANKFIDTATGNVIDRNPGAGLGPSNKWKVDAKSGYAFDPKSGKMVKLNSVDSQGNPTDGPAKDVKTGKIPDGSYFDPNTNTIKTPPMLDENGKPIKHNANAGQNPDRMPLTKTNMSKYQQELSNLMSMKATMQAGTSKYNPKWSTLGGQVEMGARSVKNWITGGNDPELTDRTQWKNAVEQNFSAFRKMITGAQAAFQELTYLRDNMLNASMSPAEYKGAENKFYQGVDILIQNYRDSLKNGMPLDDAGIANKISQLRQMGGGRAAPQSGGGNNDPLGIR